MKKASWFLLGYFVLLAIHRSIKNPKDKLYRHGFRSS